MEEVRKQRASTWSILYLNIHLGMDANSGTPQGPDQHSRLPHRRGKNQQHNKCPVLHSDASLGMDANSGTPRRPGQNSRIAHGRYKKARS